MKIKELVEKLQGYDPEAEVCIYETGMYTPIGATRFNAGTVLIFRGRIPLV